MKNLILSLLLLLICCCSTKIPKQSGEDTPNVKLIVLGNVQDAGSPHMGCQKDCCKDLWNKPNLKRKIISIGIADQQQKKNYIFEASPDMAYQIQWLQNKNKSPKIIDGIFITHAHIGHYTGLMYLGKEAMSTSKIPVFAMPRLKSFLETNGPWSQLVQFKNIELKEIENEKPVNLSPYLKVTPLKVPHRDEFSETVGFLIEGPNKKALFIPDVDKWAKWKYNIVDYIETVDYAFLDATFYNAKEIGNRDISTIPHPLVEESMSLFKNLDPKYKKRIYFIHLNHTNKLLDPKSQESKIVTQNGYNIARLGDEIRL